MRRQLTQSILPRRPNGGGDGKSNIINSLGASTRAVKAIGMAEGVRRG
jgi:hypothetical protein